MTQNEKEIAQVRREAREYWEKQLQTIVELYDQRTVKRGQTEWLIFSEKLKTL